MNRNHDEKEMSMQKRGLLIKMVQRIFEDHIYDNLNRTEFADMESLDKWLDNVLAEYFEECEAIEAYYNT